MSGYIVLDGVKGFRRRRSDDDDLLQTMETHIPHLSTGIDWLPWKSLVAIDASERSPSLESPEIALDRLASEEHNLPVSSMPNKIHDNPDKQDISLEQPPPRTKPIKMSKQERKQARLDKKISVSRNRKLKHLAETEQISGPSSTSFPLVDHEINPYVIKSRINQVRTEILSDPSISSTDRDFKIVQYHGIALYKSDIDLLSPGEWLNDNNIAFMYELIDQELLRKTLLARTAFSKQVVLLFPAIVQLFLHYPDASAAATFLPAAEIENLRFVFLPINFGDISGGWTDTGQGDHWLLALWLVLELKLYFYDSMDLGGHDDNDENAVLSQLAKRLSLCTATANNGSPIVFERLRCCQQRNFDDCGVHVVMNTCILLSRIIIHENLPGKINLDISRVQTHALGARHAMIELVKNVIGLQAGLMSDCHSTVLGQG